MEEIPDYVPKRSFLQQWEKWVLLFFVIVLAFFFFSYVWPTRYMYRESQNNLIRIDRATGEAEALTTTGWLPLQQP